MQSESDVQKSGSTSTLERKGSSKGKADLLRKYLHKGGESSKDLWRLQSKNKTKQNKQKKPTSDVSAGGATVKDSDGQDIKQGVRRA